MEEQRDTQDWTLVMAGTPVDSQMGVEVLAQHGLSGRAQAMAADPIAQTAFQNQEEAVKQAAVRQVLEEHRAAGCRRVFVYCNSLSGAVDFDQLAAETGLHIVTPLHVYRKLAQRYKHLAVISANAQGLAGIERTLYAENPALAVLGVTLLPLVGAIERGEAPEEIIRQFHLERLATWFADWGAEAVLLGCTHFPYLKDALASRIALPLVDPAEEMIHLLKSAEKQMRV